MLDGTLPHFLNLMLTVIEPNGFMEEYKPHADPPLANARGDTIMEAAQ
jgi:hypothetical protein